MPGPRVIVGLNANRPQKRFIALFSNAGPVQVYLCLAALAPFDLGSDLLLFRKYFCELVFTTMFQHSWVDVIPPSVIAFRH